MLQRKAHVYYHMDHRTTEKQFHTLHAAGQYWLNGAVCHPISYSPSIQLHRPGEGGVTVCGWMGKYQVILRLVLTIWTVSVSDGL